MYFVCQQLTSKVMPLQYNISTEREEEMAKSCDLAIKVNHSYGLKALF